MDGIKKAKDRGVQFGKRPALSEDQISELCEKRGSHGPLRPLKGHHLSISRNERHLKATSDHKFRLAPYFALSPTRPHLVDVTRNSQSFRSLTSPVCAISGSHQLSDQASAACLPFRRLTIIWKNSGHLARNSYRMSSCGRNPPATIDIVPAFSWPCGEIRTKVWRSGNIWARLTLACRAAGWAAFPGIP